MDARGILYQLLIHVDPHSRSSRSSPQKFFSRARVSRVGDHLVGGVVFACMRACTRVHCLLLSTKDRRIRFPKLSSTRRLGFSF